MNKGKEVQAGELNPAKQGLALVIWDIKTAEAQGV